MVTKKTKKKTKKKVKKKATKKKATKKAPRYTDAAKYLKHKEAMSLKTKAESADARDIGKIPKVKNKKRRDKCEFKLRLFLETYGKEVFIEEWSDDHLEFIQTLQDAILSHGLVAIGMPRGSGKTSITIFASIWAIVYGHSQYLVVVASMGSKATKILNSVKVNLQFNEILTADFPDTCYPIQKLENVPARASGQTYKGKPTLIRWTTNQIIMPYIPGSNSANSILETTGVTGSSIRGLSHTTMDGAIIRPDFCICDDIQTKKSSQSVTQTDELMEILQGDILKMAGPTKNISMVVCCTVIEINDLADQLLDRELYPEFQGMRFKMLNSMPSERAMKFWKKYNNIRIKALKENGDKKAATKYYEQNRLAMDDGAEAAWAQRFTKQEVSALQYAMNHYFINPAIFFSEFQNSPLDRHLSQDDLNAKQILAKLVDYGEGIVPMATTTITSFIDVGDDALYFVTLASGDGFTGAVIDYGIFPEQAKRNISYKDIGKSPNSLKRQFKGAGVDGSIFKGLQILTKQIMNKEWENEDGTEFQNSKILVDCGYKTDLILQFCRKSVHSASLTPAKGRFVGAKHKPISEYSRKEGEKIGREWLIAAPRGARSRLMVHTDVNYWKSFVHERLKAAIGDEGSFTISGTGRKMHMNFAAQIVAEYRETISSGSRVVDEWMNYPHKPDNHFFDCLVGASIAASMLGISLRDEKPMTKKKKSPFGAEWRKRNNLK